MKDIEFKATLSIKKIFQHLDFEVPPANGLSKIQLDYSSGNREGTRFLLQIGQFLKQAFKEDPTIDCIHIQLHSSSEGHQAGEKRATTVDGYNVEREPNPIDMQILTRYIEQLQGKLDEQTTIIIDRVSDNIRSDLKEMQMSKQSKSERMLVEQQYRYWAERYNEYDGVISSSNSLQAEKVQRNVLDDKESALVYCKKNFSEVEDSAVGQENSATISDTQVQESMPVEEMKLEVELSEDTLRELETVKEKFGEAFGVWGGLGLGVSSEVFSKMQRLIQDGIQPSAAELKETVILSENTNEKTYSAVPLNSLKNSYAVVPTIDNRALAKSRIMDCAYDLLFDIEDHGGGRHWKISIPAIFEKVENLGFVLVRRGKLIVGGSNG